MSSEPRPGPGRTIAVLTGALLVCVVVSTIAGAVVVNTGQQSAGRAGFIAASLMSAAFAAWFLPARFSIGDRFGLAVVPSLLWLVVDVAVRSFHKAEYSAVLLEAALWVPAAGLGTVLGWLLHTRRLDA